MIYTKEGRKQADDLHKEEEWLIPKKEQNYDNLQRLFSGNEPKGINVRYAHSAFPSSSLNRKSIQYTGSLRKQHLSSALQKPNQNPSKFENEKEVKFHKYPSLHHLTTSSYKTQTKLLDLSPSPKIKPKISRKA